MTYSQHTTTTFWPRSTCSATIRPQPCGTRTWPPSILNSSLGKSSAYFFVQVTYLLEKVGRGNHLLFWGFVLIFLVLLICFLWYLNSFPFICNSCFFSCSFQYFFFCTLNCVLTMICHGAFPFWSYLVGVLCASCIYMGMSFLSLGENFFYDIVKGLVYAIDLVFLFLIYADNLELLLFDGNSHLLLDVFLCFLV